MHQDGAAQDAVEATAERHPDVWERALDEPALERRVCDNSRLAQAVARLYAITVVTRPDERSQVSSGASTNVQYTGARRKGKLVVALKRAWRRLVPCGEIVSISVVKLGGSRVHAPLCSRCSPPGHREPTASVIERPGDRASAAPSIARSAPSVVVDRCCCADG